MTRVLVTGGAGFISSNLCRHLLRATDHEVVIMDALTYAGNTANIADLLGHERLAFVEGDIRDAAHVEEIVAGVDVIVNAAAESHVEKSILDGASEFVTTNVEGTQVLLDACRRHPVERFVLVSSSEVYGTAERDPMDEQHPLNPRSPYAATKAGGDRLVYSYWCTYGTPAVVVRPFNNYGPYQHPEKVIPRFITAALQDRPLTVHGGGRASRDWLHVEDTSEAIAAIIEAPLERIAGEVLNVATGVDVDVQSIAERICDSLGKPRSLITHVADRPGQVDRHIGSTGKAAELRRLARAHRLRRGPRAHDPLVRRQPGLVGGARAPPSAGAISARRPSSSSARVPASSAPMRRRGGSASRRSRAIATRRRSACARGSPTASSRSRRWMPAPSRALARARARRRADLAGHRRPGAGRGRGRGRARPAAPDRPRDGGARHRQARATPRLRRARACRSPPGAGRHGPAGRPRASSSSRPPARVSAGSRSSSRAATSAAAAAPRRRPRATAARSCEEFVEGRSSRSTRSSTPAASSPLTVTDRERALAFGVATAHLYPSLHPVAERRGGRARPPARALGIEAGPTYTQVLLAPGRAACDGGGRAPRRRPRRASSAPRRSASISAPPPCSRRSAARPGRSRRRASARPSCAS